MQRSLNLPGNLSGMYYRDPRLALSNRLVLEGSSTAPVQHWAQGLGRLAQALAGGYIMNKTDQEYKDRGDKYSNDLAQIMSPQTINASEMDPQGGSRPATMAEMLQRASSVRNPDLGPLVQNLALTAAGQEAEDQRFNTRSRMEDARWQQRFDTEGQRRNQERQEDMTFRERLAKMQMSNVAPQTIALADGVYTLNRNGTLGNKLGDVKPSGTPVAVPDPSSSTGFRYKLPTDISGTEAMDPARLRRGNDKLPTSALKMQQEEIDAIGTASTINADLGQFENMLDKGELKFGPIQNLESKARNFLGASTPESRNFASFRTNLERLRNESLRLNKGVQTDGDAQRAWSELFDNLNDPEVVRQRLGEIQRINERGAALRQMNVDMIRSNYGLDPLDTSNVRNQSPAFGNSNKRRMRFNASTGQLEPVND